MEMIKFGSETDSFMFKLQGRSYCDNPNRCILMWERHAWLRLESSSWSASPFQELEANPTAKVPTVGSFTNFEILFPWSIREKDSMVSQS